MRHSLQVERTNVEMEKTVEVILRGGRFKQYTQQELARLREKYDLKRIELEVIYFLSICGENNTVACMHEYFNANKGHISQALFTLGKRKFVTAEQDKKDRRYTHYHLTAEGFVIAGELKKVWEKVHRDLFTGVTAEEMACFQRVSQKVYENISRQLEK